METMLPVVPSRMIGRESVGWSIFLSVLLIVAGLAALLLPFVAGVLTEVVVAWLLIFGGVAHLVLAFHVRAAGAHVWEALIGVVYLVTGVFMLVHPVAGLVGLTLLLSWYLAIKGVFELMAGFQLRGLPGAGWLLVDGVLSLLIAVLIWRHLPSATAWAVGTLLGVAILFSGMSRLMLSTAARRTHAVMAL